MMNTTKELKWNKTAEFCGEWLGTFILVFFGCGTVAVTVLFRAHTSLFQVALLWGIGVTLAIYTTRHLSNAHLNPAVSIAMVLGRRMSYKKLPAYLTAQSLGAFCAAALLFLLFRDSIAQFEVANNIVRGSAESVKTAMMFGEFYPNPGAPPIAVVSMTTAFIAELVGTFTLVFLIFSLTESANVGRPKEAMVPVFIGLTVAIIIALIAPLTQAGLNPARDLLPRLFSAIAGWGDAAYPKETGGFFWVYVAAPVAGGALAALVFTRVTEPLMHARQKNLNELEG